MANRFPLTKSIPCVVSLFLFGDAIANPPSICLAPFIFAKWPNALKFDFPRHRPLLPNFVDRQQWQIPQVPAVPAYKNEGKSKKIGFLRSPFTSSSSLLLHLDVILIPRGFCFAFPSPPSSELSIPLPSHSQLSSFSLGMAIGLCGLGLKMMKLTKKGKRQIDGWEDGEQQFPELDGSST
jgi:hypothetical protein